MNDPTGPPSDGERLKHAIRRLVDEIRSKIDTEQGGVGTFADHSFLALAAQLEQLEPGRPWEESLGNLSSSIEGLKTGLQRLRQLAHRQSRGRYVDYEERVRDLAGVHGASDLGYFELVASQGEVSCLQWQGMPLFKTAYDFSLYPMILWSLRPRTIIELGSGSGASAVWMAETAATFELGATVHSVDIRLPDVSHDAVRFVRGDCEAIRDVFDAAFLRGAPRPWMVVEDAHVNVAGVLEFFDSWLAEGDYLIVEDSAAKQGELAAFISARPGRYKVDTYFTDFFGRNVTCAQDSILVRRATEGPLSPPRSQDTHD